MFKAIKARLEERARHGSGQGRSLQHKARPTMAGAGPDGHVGAGPGATSPPTPFLATPSHLCPHLYKTLHRPPTW